VFLYDTEQKIEDYYKMVQALPLPECDFAGSGLPLTWRDRPLVTVEPFTIFVHNITGEFSVRDAQTHSHLVEMYISGQAKNMRLHGLLEKGRSFPRFFAFLNYSGDGFYKRSGVSLSDDNQKSTFYRDMEGIGVFDTMRVSDRENDVETHYRLNDLTWEKIDMPARLMFPGSPM
jgi:hypothetical protein